MPSKSQKPERSSNSRIVTLFSLLFVFLAVVVAYLFYHGNNTQDILAPPPSPVRRQRIGKRSYREVAGFREPVILTNTIADRWPARETFTTTFLASRIPHVMAHRQEDKRSFITFHDDKPLEPLVSERWEEFNTKVNVTLPEVLQWGVPDKDPLKGPYLYFSQDIATLRVKFPDIVGHIQPIKELILSEDNVQVNLWVGRAGIVTHTHYDCTYNFFVQLQGRKRFTLYPPNQTLYLYPCLHPHYGHSQVDVLEPELRFPLFEGARAVTAELSPGDMLVVPPFWYHHVETLAESVSVNIWSDAPEYALINEIYTKMIPFEPEWEWSELVKATRIYINMLLRSLAIPQSFLQKLLIERYEPVVRSDNLRVNWTLVESVHDLCSQLDWHSTKLHYEPILERGIDILNPLFTRIPIRSTMETNVGNYIEHLIHRAIGLEYVYPFLASCALL